MTSATHESAPARVTNAEVAFWAVAVVVSQWFLLLGLPLALVLAFTRLRSTRPLVRWGLLVLAAAVLVVQVVGLLSSGQSSYVGPVSRVS